MTDFAITEDFPKNEIEYDRRFSDPKACYEYLFKQKWPEGFICKKCRHSKYWISAIADSVKKLENIFSISPADKIDQRQMNSLKIKSLSIQ